MHNNRIEELILSLRQETQARTDAEVSLARIQKEKAAMENELQVGFDPAYPHCLKIDLCLSFITHNAVFATG